MSLNIMALASYPLLFPEWKAGSTYSVVEKRQAISRFVPDAVNQGK